VQVWYQLQASRWINTLGRCGSFIPGWSGEFIPDWNTLVEHIGVPRSILKEFAARHSTCMTSNGRWRLDPLTISAAGGLRARIESLDLLANNLANAATAGFKADQESFNLYLSKDASADALPVVESRWTDLRQGVVQSTGNPLDLALSGSGFFVVDGPTGTLYTRNGSLQITRDGRLTTKDGYELQTVEPRRIRVDPNLPIEVGEDGTVRQQGQELGHLKLAGAPAQENISKRDGVYFSWVSTAGEVPSAAKATIRQGALESSNTSPATSAVRLVNLLRQFESLQRAIQLGGEMNRRSIEDVARTGS
jgi:flagellar basal-body rod protein FlgF